MKASLIPKLAAILVAGLCTSCCSLFGDCPEDEAEADLAFYGKVQLFNYCTGNYFYWEASNVYSFYDVSTGQIVTLLWNGRNLMNCLGYPVFLMPGTRLQSWASIINQKHPAAKQTRTAKSPFMVQEFKVLPKDGSPPIPGDTTVVVLNDLPGGSVQQVNQTITIGGMEGDYLQSFRIDPRNKILERDENNNVLSGSFSSRGVIAQECRFEIHFPTPEELASYKTPVWIVRNGRIEVINPSKSIAPALNAQ